MTIKELYTTHKFANFTHWPAANISWLTWYQAYCGNFLYITNRSFNVVSSLPEKSVVSHARTRSAYVVTVLEAQLNTSALAVTFPHLSLTLSKRSNLRPQTVRADYKEQQCVQRCQQAKWNSWLCIALTYLYIQTQNPHNSLFSLRWHLHSCCRPSSLCPGHAHSWSDCSGTPTASSQAGVCRLPVLVAV